LNHKKNSDDGLFSITKDDKNGEKDEEENQVSMKKNGAQDERMILIGK
jgi:hypothetical protein